MTAIARVIVTVAGCLHFLQLPAMIAAGRVLAWDQDLARLQPVNRLLFKAIVAFIMVTVMGLGAIVVSAPSALVDGTRLGIGLGSFLTVFWLARAATQIFVLSRALPRDSRVQRFAAASLTILYLVLGASYAVGVAVSVARSLST